METGRKLIQDQGSKGHWERRPCRQCVWKGGVVALQGIREAWRICAPECPHSCTLPLSVRPQGDLGRSGGCKGSSSHFVEDVLCVCACTRMYACARMCVYVCVYPRTSTFLVQPSLLQKGDKISMVSNNFNN